MDYIDYKRNNGRPEHFWFRAKSNLLRTLLASVYPEYRAGRRILDVGCGTGDQLPVIAGFGRAEGLDKEKRALELAAADGYLAHEGDIESTALPAGIYDCVCCLDILEHINDDRAALGNVFNALVPGGYLVYTVPAFPALYGPHDKALKHVRRYRQKEIRKKVGAVGFSLERTGCWNCLLFPLEAVFRLVFARLDRWGLRRRHKSDAGTPPWPLNRILYSILDLENKFINKGIEFPFGLTIYGIAKKN